jgi:uncharacterized protein YndB with AHSA1/START domain
METTVKTTVTVRTKINAPAVKVWNKWTTPEDIVKWNYASDDWHTPWAKNDLRLGSKFVARMEAKDGSQGFDFEGVYTRIRTHELIEYTIGDGRKVKVAFMASGNETEISEIFETEGTNPVEMQRAGWQAILDNFKKYVENK